MCVVMTGIFVRLVSYVDINTHTHRCSVPSVYFFWLVLDHLVFNTPGLNMSDRMMA